MSEISRSVSRTAALAVVMAAVLLVGVPTLNPSMGESIGAVGSAEAADVERQFILGVAELTCDSLNPNTATIVSEYLLIYYSYSYLMTYDVDMNIIGDLATEWESSPDGLEWHFELVRNAYFCDPADPTAKIHQVTAEDVEFSIMMLANTDASRLHSYWAGIVDDIVYDPMDPFSFTLYLDHIYAPIMESFLVTPIFPKYYWGSNDPLTFSNLPPIGSGPLYYAQGGLPTEGSALLKRNPVWFQTENKGWQMHTDSWLIKEQLSPDSALINLEEGNLDCYMRLPSSQYKISIPASENVVGFSQSAGFVYEYNLCQMSDELRASLGTPFTSGHNNQLLLDPVVKEAMAMAIDKQYFVDAQEIIWGLGSVADSLIPPNNPGHYTIPNPIMFNLAEAREMLMTAGWCYDEAGNIATPDTCPLAKAGGTDPLSFRFYTLNTGVTWENGANKIVEWAEDIGVELNLEIKSVSAMGTAWFTANYDVWLWDWVMGVTADPASIMSVFTSMTIGTDQDVYWVNETFDSLYNLSLITVDPVIRQELVNEMQRMAYWDFGCQCIAYSNDNYAVSTVTWDPDSLGDWNTKYMLLPDISAQWPSMQMYPNNNHAPSFTSYSGSAGPVEAEVGIPESFFASGVDDDGGVEFRWFWGDGTKTEWSSSGSATHTYAEDGVYEVWVGIREAGSSNGYEDYFITSEMLWVEVYDYGNQAPTGVTFSYAPLDPDSGTIVTFTGSASDPDGDDLYYSWTFGDGHSSGGQVVTHQFTTDGSYSVTLYVDDRHLGDGERPVSYSTGIYVSRNYPPTISVNDYSDIPVKQVRTYTATASDPEDDLRFTWYWGDGSFDVTDLPTADHVYAVKGTYTLTVYADDLTGLKDHNVSASCSVSVYNPQANKAPSISAFSVDDNTPYTWQTVTFTGTARDPDGEAMRFTFAFGDGTFYVEDIPINAGEYFTVTAEHQYATSGVKNARLYVSDGVANTSSSQVAVTVTLNYPPTIEPLVDINAFVGQTVTVTAIADDWDGDTLKYTWFWGDGAVSVTSTETASHVYSEAFDGAYWLYVDDGHGHNVSDAALVSITESGPTYTLNLIVGWNLVTIPFVNHGYTANTLGLGFGDQVASFNPATQTYDKTFVVGVYPPELDFALLPLTGYWIYANTLESIVLTGEEPTSTVTRSITVPTGGAWVLVGVPSLDDTLLASEFAAMFSGGVEQVAGYNEVTHTYDRICIPGLPLDFVIIPGEGLWMYCISSGVLSYEP